MADYRALYRKYRSQTFDEVCGQEAVTDILKYEVEEGKISHAYLFCGSRGTGKTSCAKILAKAVNCLHPRNGNPCNECEACRSIDRGLATDVIEMDAASNNGVDNVRNLKDEIAFTPAELKYRVYIVDEVHMMSQSAFNALLKTLEEPPSYVVFILATTEFNKLPTTIVSRCQRFDFRRIPSEIIMRHLAHISEKEGIVLTEDGARVIARAAQGGMRDAISLLELCAGSHTTVDAALVSETVGTGNRENAYQMMEALASADYDAVYGMIHRIVMSSADLSVFWQDLIDAYRDLMLVRTTANAKQYLDLTDGEYEGLRALAQKFTMAKIIYHTSILENALSDMQRAVNAKRSVAEIALTRMCDPKQVTSVESLSLRLEDAEKQISMLRLGVAAGVKTETLPKEVEPEAVSELDHVPAASEERAQPLVATDVPYDKFRTVLEKIGEIKHSLSVQFINATCVSGPEHRFDIRMNPFFAKRLCQSDTDLAIVRGILAEIEGVSPGEITLRILEREEGQKPAGEDLDSIFH